MPGDEWIVDTWVIATGADPIEDKSWDCLAFIDRVYRDHHIAIDQQGEVIREYSTYLRPRTHVAIWWGRMWKIAGKIEYRDSRVFKEHRDKLLNDLRFDLSDMKFVGVAYNGTSKFIVSEDSDYNSEVRDYLLDSMGITVFDIPGALARV